MKHTVSPQTEKFWVNLLRDVFYEFSEEMTDEEQIERILKPTLAKIRDGQFCGWNEKIHFETGGVSRIELQSELIASTAVIEIISVLLKEKEDSGFFVEISAADGQDANLLHSCGYVLNGLVRLNEQGAAGATLILSNTENLMILGTAKTKSDGTFSIGFIDEGRYTLVVVPPVEVQG